MTSEQNLKKKTFCRYENSELIDITADLKFRVQIMKELKIMRTLKTFQASEAYTKKFAGSDGLNQN